MSMKNPPHPGDFIRTEITECRLVKGSIIYNSRSLKERRMNQIKTMMLSGLLAMGVSAATYGDDLIDASSVRWDSKESQGNREKREKEMVRRKRWHDYANTYLSIAGKNADVVNLVQSLAIEDANMEHAVEINTALTLISLLDKKDKSLAKSIVECYERNKYWLIRVKCVEALGTHDEEKADKLSHKMLADDKVEIEAKLSLALEALGRGKLFGYPVLQEGLTSDSVYINRIAVRVLKEFENHDGQEYEKGKRVDMKAMQRLLPDSFPDNKK
jgi:hypothetical protein